jgi:Family of unknown function (DUF6445)
MSEQIIIIDDLYDIAHQYHRGFFENKCVITDETVGKISQIIGNPIEVISATNETGNLPGVFAHLESDWIAVIFLTLPLEAFGEFGLKFYSHLETGLETFPTQEEIIKYGINENQLNEIFSSDLNLWKEYANIPMKYNRMVLFRSNRWHSYESKLNNSMLYQKIIIRNA